MLLKEPKIFNRPALEPTHPPVQRFSFPGYNERDVALTTYPPYNGRG